MKFPSLPGARLLVGACVLTCLSVSAAEPVGTNAVVAATSGVIENSVVKIFSTVRYPDLYKPWTKQSPEEQTGSGVVIEGKRILTNAHVVNYASQVQIQANQAGDKISATVEYIAPGIDLAVLKLDDEKFFDTHPPIPRAKVLPGIKDSVMAYGFPEGGNSLSITKGIVSRVEFTAYSYPVFGLRIQIDAAINPGNSGGAAVAGDKMIGLTFSRLNDADNIGYIIPNEEIDLFLADIADGKYDGKPAMYETLQTLENPSLRAFLNLPAGAEGMVVHRPYQTNDAYPLKEWDVISKVGQTPVDDQGMIKVGDDLRIYFLYEIQHIATNGFLPLTVYRAGKELNLKLPVSADYPRLIPELGAGAYPSYFICGPLVFSELTGDFLGGYLRTKYAGSFMARESAGGSPMVTRLADQPAFPDERLVVISSPFFPHKLAQGYSNPHSEIIKSVNGIPVKNLKHLVEILRDSKEEFISVESYGRYAETMLFPRAQMLAATDDILTDNGVRAQGSPDTLTVWNAKK
ncbi:MAG TPA: trypsin-like peptidase domain-containing protein [Candidatus Acidoferrales bacterium]|jgi:S1-C subfamily serine protease|nr:trypsin-like peptidase domain-containing protein [Candidatus Acidoferrales bacterium]